VILDEIGRGTSTYDGLSLAWSIVEHIHDQIGCRTLFATHYHELTDLEAQLPGVRNLNVAVKEWDDQVAFLHQVVPGAAGKSYGIHVARLAGVPSAVNERARQVLALLEGGGRKAEGGREMGERRGESRACEQNGQGKVGTQLTLFEVAEHPLLETIRQANLNETTPLEALQLVAEWQRQLSRPD
jgi:DNA mismatch repair protein MutS